MLTTKEKEKKKKKKTKRKEKKRKEKKRKEKKRKEKKRKKNYVGTCKMLFKCLSPPNTPHPQFPTI
jgi:hypothetical protein